MQSPAYTMGFILSGNVNCEHRQGTRALSGCSWRRSAGAAWPDGFSNWNTARDHDAQHGDFSVKRWRFTALSTETSFVFQSLDKPYKSNCGPVVAGMPVTKT
jgi:hypothetical protein